MVPDRHLYRRASEPDFETVAALRGAVEEWTIRLWLTDGERVRAYAGSVRVRGGRLDRASVRRVRARIAAVAADAAASLMDQARRICRTHQARWERI